jgi:DNA-directed RNA polymerase specialized sigma24 family protein
MASAKLKAAIKKIKDAKKKADIRAVQKALDELGEPARSVFIVYHLHGHTLGETARLCKLPTGEIEAELPGIEKQVVDMLAPKKKADASDG